MSTEARIVELSDGQLALDDPAALGVIAAVESYNKSNSRQNCKHTLEINLV